ncbi:MAG: nitroreductase [Saprospirales bacterium]|nr:nitroreductase [Saprospirales bacterium]MBK8493083.1 nitroreductase [Saprospirales bacterium]
MESKLHPMSSLIRRRRAIFPNSYNDQPISEELIREILENANWAPTHKLTEPWRFKVFRGSALARLGNYLCEYYRAHTPAELFSEMKYKKTRNNPVRASAVIAILMQRDPDASVPEWEEIAAVAAAVQNMWLTCAAYGIGAYWSTPGSILAADDFLELRPGERCLGLFYMGNHDLGDIPGKRNPIEEKVEWLG